MFYLFNAAQIVKSFCSLISRCCKLLINHPQIEFSKQLNSTQDTIPFWMSNWTTVSKRSSSLSYTSNGIASNYNLKFKLETLIQASNCKLLVTQTTFGNMFLNFRCDGEILRSLVRCGKSCWLGFQSFHQCFPHIFEDHHIHS